MRERAQVEGPPAGRFCFPDMPSDQVLRASEEVHPASSRLNDETSHT